MKGKYLRTVILFATTGFAWYIFLQLFFVWSSAQHILGNPQQQSNKFINAFMGDPPTRMAIDSSIVWRGLFIVGFFAATAFVILNSYLKGSWLKRGFVFGTIHWLVMTPWFEFYLPYNVMLERSALVCGCRWL